MKMFLELIVAGCLVCIAPLAQADDAKHGGGAADGLFKAMDKNGDGVITKQEFDAANTARFNELDTNHDGKITQDEVDALRGKMMENVQKMIDQRFDDADANHDGALTKAEAEKMPMVLARFDDLDANKDGKVSKQELAEGIKKMRENMPGGMHDKHGAPEASKPGQK